MEENQLLQRMNIEKLSIEEIVMQVNKFKTKGWSLTKIEKECGVREKYISDKLRKRYTLDKDTNQYVLKDVVVTEGNGVTTEQDYKVKHEPIVTRSNGVLQQTEKKKELEEQSQHKSVFTTEQVDILHRIIKEYQTRQQIQSTAEIDKGKTINRNVRVYEKQFEIFANWCKENNVTQADALYKAIDSLIYR